MDTEKIEEKIKSEHPRLIYLSGKTCTGKTTFANYLAQHGYEIIELDKIVTESVVVPFNVPPGDGFRTAYRGLGPEEQIHAFTTAAALKIREEVRSFPLVIEGAVAKAEILNEIFLDDLSEFVFVYFHPIHADVYEQRILSRFVAGAKNGTTGLPKDFWALVTPADLSTFTETEKVNDGILGAIREYAQKSMDESKARLAHLRTSFPGIAVIEI